MDLGSIQQALKDLAATNVTKTVYTKAYPAISPTRPELSQAGRVVLITGGGSGIGFSIARCFVRASAASIIILGRRQSVLETAASLLEAEAKAAGTKTKIAARSCDLVKNEDIEAFWNDLTAQNITVDILVHSAAKFTEPKPMLELGADEIWSQTEANAKTPLYLTEKFCAQKTDKQRVSILLHPMLLCFLKNIGQTQAHRSQFIVNLTSGVIHSFGHPAVAQRPGYVFSKAAGALYFQLLAQETPHEKIQIVNMHPGLVYNDTWKKMGVPEEWFEDGEKAISLSLPSRAKLIFMM